MRAKKGLWRHFSRRLRGARALHGVIRWPIAARRRLRTTAPVRLARKPVVGGQKHGVGRGAKFWYQTQWTLHGVHDTRTLRPLPACAARRPRRFLMLTRHELRLSRAQTRPARRLLHVHSMQRGGCGSECCWDPDRMLCTGGARCGVRGCRARSCMMYGVCRTCVCARASASVC